MSRLPVQPRLMFEQGLSFDDYAARVTALEMSVLTIKDVVNGWGKARGTVINAINSGKLVAAKKDVEPNKPNSGYWIIEPASVTALWGKGLR